MNEAAAAPATSHDARERWIEFSRFLWRRYRDESLFEAAGALSFTTVFALVPLTTAVLGVMSAFPVFGQWTQAVTDFVFRNFVPAAGTQVHDYLLQFADNAKKLTTAGVLALLVSALLMISSIEDAFNRIWRAPGRRRRFTRFIVYWTVLTLGPVLVAASLGLSSYALTLPLLGDADRELGLSQRLLTLLPAVVTWTALTLAYLVVPNAVVRPRNAAIGGAIATVLFELAKYAFAIWVGSTNYEQIYGAIAVLPVLLVWIYLSWVVVLLGASIAASLSAYRFQPPALRVPPGLEFAALLRVMGRIADGARSGDPLSRARLRSDEPGLTDEQLDRFLGQLEQARLAQPTEAGGWVLLRDPAAVPARELFEAGGYRWPTDDELGRAGALAAGPWLARGRDALAPLLDAPLTSLIASLQSAAHIAAPRGDPPA